jgi:hypothetical protein
MPLPCTFLACPTPSLNSFEISSINSKLSQSKFIVENTYHPLSTHAKSRNKSSFTHFTEDFQCFISSVTTPHYEFLITGGFHIHVDDSSDNYSQQFLSTLSHANVTQHVSFPLHYRHHVLDQVITTANSSLPPFVTHTIHSPSDQVPIVPSLNITPPEPSLFDKHSFCSSKSINICSFSLNILSSTLMIHRPTNPSDLVD